VSGGNVENVFKNFFRKDYVNEDEEEYGRRR